MGRVEYPLVSVRPPARFQTVPETGDRSITDVVRHHSPRLPLVGRRVLPREGLCIDTGEEVASLADGGIDTSQREAARDHSPALTTPLTPRHARGEGGEARPRRSSEAEARRTRLPRRFVGTSREDPR